jgi:hypothetical protein
MASAPDHFPTVSYVDEDQTLLELVYDARSRTTAFALSRPDQAPALVPHFDLPGGGRLVPYSATNNLVASGCVKLPSDLGDVLSTAELVGRIQAFLDRHVVLSPAFREIAPWYVLLSWVYDAFAELPYLRFRGDYGTGKSRALLAVGSLCYKPFFASGASTVSPIFHILNAFQGTLLLDEADFRFSDATSELVKILNNGNAAGLPVLRTLTNKNRELTPTAFKVYGPKILAMRKGFQDEALESRFITEETAKRPLDGSIPLHMPPDFAREAGALRNALLAWRLTNRFRVGVRPDRALQGVEPRVNQTALALLSLIDRSSTRALIARHLSAEQVRIYEERQRSLEGLMIASLLAVRRRGSTDLAVGDVTEAFNRAAAALLDAPVTARWVGNFLRARLQLTTVKAHSVYVIARTQAPAISALAAKYGLRDTTAA